MKNIILFLVLLGIMTGNTFSANPSVIWGGSGDALVLPPNGFTLESGTKIYDLSVDPSVSAVNAPIGSYGTYLGKLYVKQDAGSTTNWIPLQQELTVPLPIAEGGTNSSTALANDKVMYSQGDAVVESVVGLDASGNLSTIGDLKVGAGTALEFDLIQSLYRARNTGLAEPNGLSINGGDNTKYDIASSSGQIVDFDLGTYTVINYAGSTLNAPATANGVTYVYINSAGAIVTETTAPTGEDRREKIYLGRVITVGGVIVQVLDEPVVTENTANGLYDLAKAIRIFNENGNLFTANGANLSLNKSAGSIFSVGANYTTNRNRPHTVTSTSCTVCTFAYITRLAGSTGANVTVLDPTQYDNAGTITAVGGPPASSTIQRIYLFPSGAIRIQYGQTVYPKLADALQGLSSASFVENPSIAGNGILMGFIVAQRNATDLTDTTKARILYASRFGEGTVGAAGQAVSSLQNAYDNSAEGNIVLDAVRFGFTVLDNSTPIGNPLFEVLSNDNLSNYFTVSASSISSEIDMDYVGTGYVKLPSGDTSERPLATTSGRQRFNTDNEKMEMTEDNIWTEIVSVDTSTSIPDGAFLTRDSTVAGKHIYSTAIQGTLNPVTDWVSGTCTSSFTTNTTTACKYRRVGDTAEVKAQLVFTGAPNATTFELTTPDGLVIDTTKLSQTIIGKSKIGYGYVIAGASTTKNPIDIVYYSTTSVRAFAGNATATYVTSNGTVNATTPLNAIGNGDYLEVSYSVPIQGWTSGLDAVAQNIEKNAQNSNEFDVLVSNTGVVTGDDYDIINGNCTVNSTGNFTCNFNSGIFTEAPKCGTTINQTNSSTIVTQVDTATTSSVNYLTYATNDGSQGPNSRGVKLSCSKSGADINRSQVITATLQGINSSDLVVVEGLSNASQSITANVTNISFTETSDSQGVWSGSELTVNKNGIYTFEGSEQSTASSARTIDLWVDPVGASPYEFKARCNQSANSTAQKFQCTAKLNAGDKAGLRSDITHTLQNAGTAHRIIITQSADYEAIVQNLNDSIGLVAYLKDIKPNNTTGGGCTAGSYAKHDLTTIEGNSSLVTLASSEFTLKAGTYELNGYSTMSSANRHRAKIRNITTGTDAILGDSAYTTSSTNVHTKSFFDGIIVVPSDQTFQLQYRCETTDSSDGLGVASNFGEPELFALVKIRKIGN